MAEAMTDVIQDHTITQNCQIDKEFVEKWALAQLLMKDKLFWRSAIGDRRW
jgi:hypothetical protein